MFILVKAAVAYMVCAVFTVMVVPVLNALILPAASVALAFMVWLASVSCELMIDQLPPVAMAVPNTVAPSVSYKIIEAPFSAVPVKVGLLMVMFDGVPVMAGADGASGALVSKLMDGVAPAPPLLPARSV